MEFFFSGRGRENIKTHSATLRIFSGGKTFTDELLALIATACCGKDRNPDVLEPHRKVAADRLPSTVQVTEERRKGLAKLTREWAE